MPKYLARLYCTVEVPIEADNIEQAMQRADLTSDEVNNLPHSIIEIDDVMEMEEL